MKLVFSILLVGVSFLTIAQQSNFTDSKGMKQGFWSICADSSCEVGCFVNSQRTGAWVFYKKGRLEKICTFKKDILDGFSISFNVNGSIYRKFFYRNGKLNDKAEFYSKEGLLLARYHYLNDNILTVEYYAINSESPPRHHGYVPHIK